MVNIKVYNGNFPLKLRVQNILYLVSVTILQISAGHCHIVDKAETIGHVLRILENFVVVVTTIFKSYGIYIVLPKMPA